MESLTGKDIPVHTIDDKYELVCIKSDDVCCEDCTFFNEPKNCGKYQIIAKIRHINCGEKYVFRKIEKTETEDKENLPMRENDPMTNGDTGKSGTCIGCKFYSCRSGYAPHCHYKGTKKSPVITESYKCPKMAKS